VAVQPQDEERSADRAQAVSLAPLTPEEALRALLAVDPEDEPAENESNHGKGKERPDPEETQPG